MIYKPYCFIYNKLLVVFMVNYEEQIKQLEEEIKKTQYNKATQHHIGLVKAKIANLKEKQQARSKGGKTIGYDVRKTGDGTAIIVGFPSVGKSTLLNHLTDASSPVGHYAFTTLKVFPGVMHYKYAKIQILDVPGIVKGAASGTGRGREVLSTMRSADLALIMIDVNHPEHYDILIKEVYDTGLRLNEKKPDVIIKKTARGGIRIGKTVRLDMMEETIELILKEFRINNADVLIRSRINEDQLIDVIEGNRIYIPSITILNKIDTVSKAKVKYIKKKINADIAISAEKSDLNELKELIFKKLNLIRIFLKEPGNEADMEVPLIMFNDCKIRDVCRKLHKDFEAKFRFARIWGKSVKFLGMKIIKLDHKLQDKDILELHIK